MTGHYLRFHDIIQNNQIQYSLVPIYDVFRCCVWVSRTHLRRQNSSVIFKVVESWIASYYEFNPIRAGVIQSSEFQLVISPAAVSLLQLSEYSRVEVLQQEVELLAKTFGHTLS